MHSSFYRMIVEMALLTFNVKSEVADALTPASDIFTS